MDAKGVWRAGLAPARVFGRTGHPMAGFPLRSYDDKWFAPWVETWALRGTPDDCKVIKRAVESYGLRPSSKSKSLALGRFIALPGETVTIDLLEDTREWHLRDGTAVDGVELDGFVYCSYPIAYLLRRWGTVDCWYRRPSGVIVATVDVQSVGILGAWPRDYLNEGPPPPKPKRASRKAVELDATAPQ